MSADFDKAFGAKVRAIREAAGLSQQELAARMSCGWLQSTVSKIETGQRPLWLREATRLADRLGTGLADLLSESGITSGERLRSAERALRERIAAEILEGGAS
jgi:transcriptional regulator with XRE-family HTH domain